MRAPVTAQIKTTAGIIGLRMDFAPRKNTRPPLVSVFAMLASNSAKMSSRIGRPALRFMSITENATASISAAPPRKLQAISAPAPRYTRAAFATNITQVNTTPNLMAGSSLNGFENPESFALWLREARNFM